MLKTFWVIVVMVGCLWVPNARYAVRQYLADRNKVLFTTYMVLLIGLGYMLVSVTTKVMTLVQSSQDVFSSR